jgi:hypothetical protein
VTRSSTEPSIVILTSQNKVDGLVTRKGVWMAQKVKGCKTPIHPIESQVLSQPIVELIFSLGRYQIPDGPKSLT